jgi:hypothetical protein
MPPSLPPALLLTLGILVSLVLVVVIIILGLLWSRLKSVSLIETEKLIEDVATRLHDLDERLTHSDARAKGHDVPGLATQAPGGPAGVLRAGRGESSRRVDQGVPSGIGRPPLIAIPNLTEPPSAEETASVELARRFGAIWELADSGVSTDAIARVSGYPIGQVELILGLRRQLASSAPVAVSPAAEGLD